MTYLLGDHLGSTSLTTDTLGNFVSELRYKPWGETRYSSGTTATSYRYTGQREEVSFGLYFYNARWYDPYLNRFVQPDMIIPGMEIPQSWNRFSYVGNNPITHNDPDGRCYPVCTALIGAGIGAITGAVIYAATNTGDNFKWGELAVAAGAGALAGGLIGTGLARSRKRTMAIAKHPVAQRSGHRSTRFG